MTLLGQAPASSGTSASCPAVISAQSTATVIGCGKSAACPAPTRIRRARSAWPRRRRAASRPPLAVRFRARPHRAPGRERALVPAPDADLTVLAVTRCRCGPLRPSRRAQVIWCLIAAADGLGDLAGTSFSYRDPGSDSVPGDPRDDELDLPIRLSDYRWRATLMRIQLMRGRAATTFSMDPDFFSMARAWRTGTRQAPGSRSIRKKASTSSTAVGNAPCRFEPARPQTCRKRPGVRHDAHPSGHTDRRWTSEPDGRLSASSVPRIYQSGVVAADQRRNSGQRTRTAGKLTLPSGLAAARSELGILCDHRVRTSAGQAG